MKILVKSRSWVKSQLNNNPEWHMNKWIISIYSSDSQSPFLPRYNILQLNFDDVSERDVSFGWNIHENSNNAIFFNEYHAKEINKFISEINVLSDKIMYIHCDAGISRSGAVGYVLNEYFNKSLFDNKEDYHFFKVNNPHIMPNPLVVRILKNELFGVPFANIEVNDYEYDEEGNKIDHIKLI